MNLHPKYRDFYYIAKRQDDNTYDVFFNPLGKKHKTSKLSKQLVFEGNFDTYDEAYNAIEAIARRKQREAYDEIETFTQFFKNQK